MPANDPFEALDGLHLPSDPVVGTATDPRSRSFRGTFARNLELPDLWQQDAIRALQEGHDVIVDAPTGAGKTLIFETFLQGGTTTTAGGSLAHHTSDDQRQAVYTVPTRALANDKRREWQQRGWQVGIATGDIAENLDAPLLVATLETQRERLLRSEPDQAQPRILVVDEYQMIADARRGINYELAIALAPATTQLLLLSGSVANPEKVAAWLQRLGRSAKVISTHHRPVPLDDMPLQALPEPAPRNIRNHWQRLAIGALLSDLGPLLIFAPQRSVAEKIARKIASALPADDPVPLDQRTTQIAGPELTRLLRKRVALHHSGLSYEQRARIVEPLAKAGQLRVIVATTGLAAGINFSVRSVHITDIHYQHGPFHHSFGPDELLQMYGRAGRRGLDQQGYAISTDTSPRLSDARRQELRRSNDLDWPTLLRVMHRAAQNQRDPFAAAADIRDRLFSEQHIRLGFANSKNANTEAINPPKPATNLFGLQPVESQVLNSLGEWESYDPSPEKNTTNLLADSHSHYRDKWRPALTDPQLIQSLLPAGARLTKHSDKTYGFEIAIGNHQSDDTYRLNKRIRTLTKRQGSLAQMSHDRIQALLPNALQSTIPHGHIETIEERNQTLYAIGNFRRATITTYRDHKGKSLIQPPRRSHTHEAPTTHYTNAATGTDHQPPAGTAAHAWRSLRLITPDGTPTTRGRLFSYFQHGEGLAIAAAITDPHYPLEELIDHLANLRGGHRFEHNATNDSEGSGSERLAYTCRQTYGTADHPGYLELGLPPGYGEGTAEAIAHWLRRSTPARPSQQTTSPARDPINAAGAGDIERAFVEWLSLLRHICHTPTDLDSHLPRWAAFRQLATTRLQQHQHRHAAVRHPAGTPATDLIPGTILARLPRHHLSSRQLRQHS